MCVILIFFFFLYIYRFVRVNLYYINPMTTQTDNTHTNSIILFLQNSEKKSRQVHITKLHLTKNRNYSTLLKTHSVPEKQTFSLKFMREIIFH